MPKVDTKQGVCPFGHHTRLAKHLLTFDAFLCNEMVAKNGRKLSNLFYFLSLVVRRCIYASLPLHCYLAEEILFTATEELGFDTSSKEIYKFSSAVTNTIVPGIQDRIICLPQTDVCLRPIH